MMTNAPLWLQAYKQKHLHAYATLGIPSRKTERWKYADLSQIVKLCQATQTLPKINLTPANSKIGIGIVLNNGYLQAKQNIASEVIVCSLAEAIQQHEKLLQPYIKHEFDSKQYPFASLNAANTQDGLFIYIPDDFNLIRPLHFFVNMAAESEFTTHPQHVIMMGKNSKLTIIEEYQTNNKQACMLNQLKFIFLDEGADLTFYKLQRANNNFVQLNHCFVEQKANSQSTFMNFVADNVFNREDVHVKLNGSGAVCNTRGFYHLQKANEYLDNHIDIIHRAPNTKSEMLFKGILENNSRVVFNGRLHVEKDAQKILAYQANHNLLLSKTAEAYSKPELEIYADDVKCKHGATTGQIDEEALFFLRSRGIPVVAAQRMLLAGFAEDVLQHIEQTDIKQYIKEFMPC